jgi:hypothetical protein
MMQQIFLYQTNSPQPASSSHLHVADHVAHNYVTNAFVISDENCCGGCCDVTLYLRSVATPHVDAGGIWDTAPVDIPPPVMVLATATEVEFCCDVDHCFRTPNRLLR